MLTYEELYPRGCFGEWDHWLQERTLSILPALEARPGASLNALLDTHRQRAGAYRMVEHPEVSLQRLLEPAAQALRTRPTRTRPTAARSSRACPSAAGRSQR